MSLIDNWASTKVETIPFHGRENLLSILLGKFYKGIPWSLVGGLFYIFTVL